MWFTFSLQVFFIKKKKNQTLKFQPQWHHWDLTGIIKKWQCYIFSPQKTWLIKNRMNNNQSCLNKASRDGFYFVEIIDKVTRLRSHYWCTGSKTSETEMWDDFFFPHHELHKSFWVWREWAGLVFSGGGITLEERFPINCSVWEISLFPKLNHMHNWPVKQDATLLEQPEWVNHRERCLFCANPSTSHPYWKKLNLLDVKEQYYGRICHTRAWVHLLLIFL